MLHWLAADELPWYGPSFGEEPEALGEIKVELLPGRRMRTTLGSERGRLSRMFKMFKGSR